MGSGARAERMAAGASIGEKKEYLKTLLAEAEDVSSVTESQQNKIQTLMDQIQTPQPQFVQEAEEALSEINPIVIIAIILGLFLWLNRR